MSAQGERSTLDGNAAGGLLCEVFAFDAIELGAILRCPSCDQAVVRIGRTSRGLWLDLRGATTVVAADSATP
jgi:hypothetical protein